MSGSLGFAEHHWAELGVKLIAIDRPGLGRSTFNPAGSLLSWQDDIKELIHQRNLRRPSAVGFSQGAPYALQLGAAGLVETLALVAGQDDFDHPPTFSLLPDHLRKMIYFLNSDETAFFETIGSTADANWLWTMIMEMSSNSDKSVYGSERFAEAYRACLQEGFRQVARGYMQDLANTWRPSPFRVETVTIPVDLWYGLDDTSPVHSPDHGQLLADRMGTVRRYLIEGEGSAILWKLGERIVTMMLSRAER